MKSQNSRNQGFSYYFCLMIEGSGSIPLTNGSGSRTRIQIRIRNTVKKTGGKGDLEELPLCEGEVLLREDVEEDVLLQLPPLLRVDQRLQRLVHLLRRVERDVVLHGKSVTI
jgi:hypothetical protein